MMKKSSCVEFNLLEFTDTDVELFLDVRLERYFTFSKKYIDALNLHI